MMGTGTRFPTNCAKQGSHGPTHTAVSPKFVSGRSVAMGM